MVPALTEGVALGHDLPLPVRRRSRSNSAGTHGGRGGMASEFSPARIFISYARADGPEFAEVLERRLVDEAGITSWRDLKRGDVPRDVEHGGRRGRR